MLEKKGKRKSTQKTVKDEEKKNEADKDKKKGRSLGESEKMAAQLAVSGRVVFP